MSRSSRLRTLAGVGAAGGGRAAVDERRDRAFTGVPRGTDSRLLRGTDSEAFTGVLRRADTEAMGAVLRAAGDVMTAFVAGGTTGGGARTTGAARAGRTVVVCGRRRSVAARRVIAWCRFS